ncbi:MAG TPA: anti-sigma factor [Solirubrobacteraceae bacterium]|nr:anti-sigma factor [Solirubrobacteraceae bacterium]
MSEHDCGNDAAAYALGALEPEEAHAFERHMESCAVCRDEVAAFVLAADALPLAAPQHAAPRALRRRVMREVAQQSRQSAPRVPALKRAPRRVAAGFAVALAAAALVVGISLGTGGSATTVIKASVGSAELQVSSGHGQLVVAHLSRPAAGRIYELWIQHGSSKPSPSTLFSVASNGTADVGVPGSLHGVSRLLVTDEPAGGSRAPTTPPVIVAALS